jgi:NAD(P)-dependent dehydrogenase (short-subunit alcohol dehydrogenase family)
MRLKNKVAVITGAGSGIGRASACRFAEEGARVCVVDIDAAAGRETAVQVQAAGGFALSLTADVSRSDQVNACIGETEQKLGRIDILYNNAAITSLAPTLTLTDDELDRVLAVNLKSMFYTSRAVLPGMIARKAGVILNNASITGIVGAPGMAAYATSKGAIITLTRTLALEQAENGIRVNCICPASVDTAMLQASFDRTSNPEQARTNNIRRHPLGRFATPLDVANLALFLVSDESAFITGATSVIDGGALLARRWQE